MNAASTPDKLPQGEALFGKPPPDAGEWLFKDKDQVLGPVPPEMLLAKLYDGHVTADTPVAKDVGQWKPLKEIWFLGPHVSRAQQKLAWQVAAAERQAAQSRFAKTRWTVAGVVCAVLFAGAFAAGRQLMIARPWEDKTDWMAKRPNMEPLPDRTPKLVAVVKKDPEPAPPVEAAPAEEKPVAQVDEKPDRKGDKRGKDKKKGKDAKADKKDEKTAANAPKTDGMKVGGGPAEGAVPQELTPEQMKAVFKGGAGGYTACIREEAARNTELPPTITVEFVIKNDGSTGDFTLQEKEIRNGPLATCLGGRIGALKFPRFSGERKTFIFPFKITRR